MTFINSAITILNIFASFCLIFSENLETFSTAIYLFLLLFIYFYYYVLSQLWPLSAIFWGVCLCVCVLWQLIFLLYVTFYFFCMSTHYPIMFYDKVALLVSVAYAFLNNFFITLFFHHFLCRCFFMFLVDNLMDLCVCDFSWFDDIFRIDLF